jgi:hypothetical protein
MNTQGVLNNFSHIDESKLTTTDRLGLAYCRLSVGFWDDLLGTKPDAVFPDGPPNPSPAEPLEIIYGLAPNADPLATAIMSSIRDMIGEANTSRCFQIFILGKTEAEWFRWYTVERHLRDHREESRSYTHRKSSSTLTLFL